MPLTPQDQEYWRYKLGWRTFLQMSASMMVIGCVLWPMAGFLVSWSQGHAGDWTWTAVREMAGANFFLALLISSVLWSLGRIFYLLDWLPSVR